MDPLSPFPLDDLLFGGIGAVGKIRGDIVEIHSRTGSAAPADMIDRQIVRNPENPGVHVDWLAPIAELNIQAQKCFLCQFFSVRLIPGDTAQIAKHGGMALFEVA